MVLILSRNKITPEAVIDPVAQNLEAAGHWRRASTRWLLVMGDFECTEAQREWLLLRRNYCLRRYLPLAPVKLDISDVTK
ncbi:PerC family transcriptional regulator [Salmonella enterica subsp. enterica serovar Hillegersberg]|nr:PerC family transcriptional regulator [Salmonella enterica]MCB7133051.1 PerC family transcriptional regulator [Salmonella enterica subsp. enterica serovar Hillegersberg]